MTKPIILSEIALPGIASEYEVLHPHYGNRLLSYLFPGKMRKALIRYAGKTGINAVVCCRAAAKYISDMDYPDLKFLHLTSTGFDGVPIKQYNEKGVAVANLRGTYNVPIAETVVYALLCMAKKLTDNPKRHLPKLFRAYRCMTELSGKRVLVMGAGRIGTDIAIRLAGMDMTVFGYDPFASLHSPFSGMVQTKDELLSLLSEYDYVISTVPATTTSEKLCDTDFFRNMKRTAVFFNVGRAATVDTDALYNALKHHEIGGAILDTVELLPYCFFHRFRRLRNTLVLPGIATISQESEKRVKDSIEEQITTFFNTGTCDCILKPEERT